MTYSKFNKGVRLRKFGRLPDAILSFSTERYIIKGVFLGLKFDFTYLSLSKRRVKC